MLTHYIAAGIVVAATGGGSIVTPITGPIIAVPERTVTVPLVQPATAIGNALPLGAPTWTQVFEPGDQTPWAMDFSSLLAASERVAAIEALRMSPAAAALGLRFNTDPAYAPRIDSGAGRLIQFWLLVGDALQQEAAWDATGIRLPITARVRTTSFPPKRFERSGVLQARQQ